jgi:hypothetical protein
MTIETQLYTALKNLVSNRVYRGLAPDTVTALPRITFQQVGGTGINFLEGGPVGLHQPRIQFNVWHSSYDAATALAIQVENALLSVPALQAHKLGEFIAVHEEATGLFGTQQDFQFGTT